MPTEQYHEPPQELSNETRTFARMIQSLIEEAEAINWYEQRISVEKDRVCWCESQEKRATQKWCSPQTISK